LPQKRGARQPQKDEVMRELRAGVIGAGVFAGFHARKYASLEGVNLIGLYDPSDEAAQKLAAELGVTAFHTVEELLAAVDIVTIASPAIYHAKGALSAVTAGCHAYVEKPIAVDLGDADKILVMAAAHNLVVAVGHQERAVFAAMGLLDVPEQPLRLEAVRFGTASPRNLDVSSTLDLMIHDIDLALALTTGEAVTVEAEGDDDAMEAEVTFDNGFTASFAVSRVAPERKRTIRVVYPSGEVAIDMLTREFSNTTPFALDPNFTETVAGKDPLGASVRGFIDAVRGDSPRPLVTGAEAAKALDVALAVEQAALED